MDIALSVTVYENCIEHRWGYETHVRKKVAVHEGAIDAASLAVLTSLTGGSSYGRRYTFEGEELTIESITVDMVKLPDEQFRLVAEMVATRRV